MDPAAPDPTFARDDDLLWLAYRTYRGDHFAVLQFEGLDEFEFRELPDEGVELLTGFHEVHDEAVAARGHRRWVVTFQHEALEVRARRARVVVRAVQALSAEHALAAVRA